MYTAAELFNLATMADAKEVFLSNVTMSIPDDLPGCANLDAEKDRLSKIWEVAHMSINEMVAAVGLSKTNFAKETAASMKWLLPLVLRKRTLQKKRASRLGRFKTGGSERERRLCTFVFFWQNISGCSK